MKEPHPLTRYLPEFVNQDEVANQIQADGLLEPVVLLQDMVIEGRVRQRAANDVGVPLKYRTWSGEGDPFDWMVDHHIKSHQLDRQQTVRFAGQLIPYYKSTPGALAPRMAAATGLGQHTLRQIAKFVEHRLLDKVLDGTLSWDDALRRVGMANKVKVKLGATYGKGDPFDKASEPLLRYLSAWESRNYEFRHVPPKEAARRLKVIEQLQKGLEAAKADLEPRSVRPRHTTPSK